MSDPRKIKKYNKSKNEICSNENIYELKSAFPKNTHPCNGTFDYCNGFADGYQHQTEVSFPELNLD